MPTLYLIDAYAQFFRHYHAIRTPMTSPVTKEPTNMTFGFVGLLLKLLKADPASTPNLAKAGRPDYIAVALDVSGDKETFRSELYPDYKAHRPPPPEDLFPQVDRCLAMLRVLGVPIVGAAGFEADDVIATLVTTLRATHPDLKIRMVSKDKDLKQLLDDASADDPRVELFDVHTDTPFSAATLETETGLTPAQVVDMLALTGDSVDNVPGVEGVGEKTAAQLLRDYRTLDNLLAHAGEIKGKRGEKLREAAELLDLSRRLVTLRRDVPVSFSLSDAAVAKIHLDRLIPILKELGFNRYQDEVRALLGTGPTPPSADRPMPFTPTPARSPARPPEPSSPFQGGLFDAVAHPAGATTMPQSGEYRAITTRRDLDALVRDLRRADIIALDTETTSLSPHDAKLCGISIAIKPGAAVYIPVRSPSPAAHLDETAVLGALRPILEDPERPKCGHNLKYDLLIFRAHNVTLRGIAFDSMVSSYLIDASRSSHSLDALALALLGRTNISLSELIGSGKAQRTFDTVPLEQATQYAAEDADVALQLRDVLLPQLRAMQLTKLFDDVEMPLVEVLAELEWNGILVEPAELDRQRHRLEHKIAELRARLDAESKAALGRTFDPDSPKQLSAVLFAAPVDEPPGLGLKPVKRTKTGFSTDAEVLDKLGQDETITTPIPALILDYRELSKLVSTYLVALKDAIHPATKRVHTSFHQTVAATGRLASSDPNLQNIPIRTDVGREIRRAFIAPPGSLLVTADYSQIELRLLAHLSRDPALTAAFHAGEDIHTAVAAQIHNVPPEKVTREQRAGAKMVNFGIVYGITAFGLARRLDIPEKQAAEIITGYKKRFAGITTFLQECVEQARRLGYVETILGRRRPIPDIHTNIPARRAFAERLSINSVVQGSAADLIKIAMVDLYRLLRREDESRGPLAGVKMLLQIHDELVFEAPEPAAEPARAIIVERMESAMSLSVPLKADAHIARTWYDGK